VIDARTRRLVTAALAAVLTLGIPASALGAPATPVPTTEPAPAPAPAQTPPRPKVTETQALAALRGFFSIPEKRANFDYQGTLVTEGNKQMWRFEASYRDGNMGMGFTLGAVDAMTGRILQFSGTHMLPRPIRLGRLAYEKSREDAWARAEALLKKVVPDRFDRLREATSLVLGYYNPAIENQGDVYTFTLVEYVDDIPFPASSVTVGVHKQTLEYVSLQVGLQDGLTFPRGPAKVTAEEALKVYQTKVAPALSYQLIPLSYPYGYSKIAEVKLLYSMGNMWRAVDAMTGRWAEEPIYGPPPGKEETPREPEPVPAGNVTPVKASALPLTKADARAMAGVILEIPPEDLRSEEGMWMDNDQHRFSFYNEKMSASVQLDPKSGLIRNAWRNNYSPAVPSMPGKGDPQPDPVVTPEMEEQAKQAAFTVVQTYYSQVAGQMRLTSPDPYWTENPAQPTRHFRFIRQVNGLDLPNDSLYISIDLSTMKWREISSNLTMGLEFPDPADVISPEKARDAALAGRQPILIYRPVYPKPTQEGPYYGPMPQPTEAQLVYVLRPEPYGSQIDAKTGEPFVWNGYGAAELADAYGKVDDHWAEGEFQYFLSRGTILPGQLNPDGTLSRGLAVALLLARGTEFEKPFGPTMDIPYTDLEEHAAYDTVRTAWHQGWLRPVGTETAFRPDAPVTRAEFAVWAVRALGYGPLARAELLSTRDRYSDMADLTAEQRNAINFLSALGLLGQAETFRGAEPMTQAEGVSLTARIYNFLLASK
jgi:hypothetical protein